MRYIKTFALFENKMYVTHNEVPTDIINWAENKIGTGFKNKISVIQGGKVEINIPWHEADREYYQFFKLIDPKTAKISGNEITKSGLEGNEGSGTVNVPSGFVLACAGTYPKRLELFTSDDSLKAVGDASVLDDFTINELLILLQAKGLNSFARTKYPEKEYERLIQQGYLNKNKSITTKGKNLILMPEVNQKLDAYAKEKGKYFDGYKIR